jgi:hypothetical protein
MKRVRVSTLMLLLVIAALCMALVVQDRRAARREAALLSQLTESDLQIKELYYHNRALKNFLKPFEPPSGWFGRSEVEIVPKGISTSDRFGGAERQSDGKK